VEKFENVLLKLNLDDFDVNLYEYLERNLKGLEFIYFLEVHVTAAIELWEMKCLGGGLGKFNGTE